MKRRSFIKSLSLVGLGMILSSRILASIASTMSHSYFYLTSSKEQIRHGVFELRESNIREFPNWFSVFEKQRFFANGFDSGVEDLVSFQFKLDGSLYGVQQLKNRTYLTYDNEIVDLSSIGHCKISRKQHEIIVHRAAEVRVNKNSVLLFVRNELVNLQKTMNPSHLIHVRVNDRFEIAEGDLLLELKKSKLLFLDSTFIKLLTK